MCPARPRLKQASASSPRPAVRCVASSSPRAKNFSWLPKRSSVSVADAGGISPPRREAGAMPESDPKADLHRYLDAARDALVWKLDGLSEYDIRRPMVPTGTNLLGLIKHVASVEIGYFGETFGRPSEEPL